MAPPPPLLDKETLELYTDPAYSMSQPDLQCPPTLDAPILINPAGITLTCWDDSDDSLENVDVNGDDSTNLIVKDH
jgi:hypothetical protein